MANLRSALFPLLFAASAAAADPVPRETPGALVLQDITLADGRTVIGLLDEAGTAIDLIDEKTGKKIATVQVKPGEVVRTVDRAPVPRKDAAADPTPAEKQLAAAEKRIAVLANSLVSARQRYSEAAKLYSVQHARLQTAQSQTPAEADRVLAQEVRLAQEQEATRDEIPKAEKRLEEAMREYRAMGGTKDLGEIGTKRRK